VSLDWPDPDGRPACGVIGWPVTYSLSPVIHEAAFRALGISWRYLHLPVPPGALREATERLASDGYTGANVTIPHKTQAAGIATPLSEDAARLNAVNTLVSCGGTFAGENTDAPGFANFLARDAGWDPSGRSALIYGAGGAARACVLALARAGLASLVVAVRETGRAERLLHLAASLGLEAEAVALGEALGRPCDLLVNATPVGRGRESLPLPKLGPEVLVVDLIYRPGATAMLEAARGAGAPAFGGLGLLVHQAALSFELFTGAPAPLEIMREAALSGLEGP
jgi:shikimate dehydrogenase